jgi:hypothetical protein
MEATETGDLYEYTDNLYTETQQKVLYALPIIPGILSMIGSSLILYVILSDAKRKLQRVYHRVLMAYSTIDVMVSLQYVLSSLVVPKGTPGTYGAIGNWYTCQASAFFLQFGFSLGLYLAFICLYYLLMVKYRVRGENIAKKIEVYVHMFAFLVPLLQGVLMVVLDMYNPGNITTGQCFINCYPANCLREDDVQCERGENYIVWVLVAYPQLFVSFIAVLITSVLTYQTVNKTNNRQSQWNFSRSNLNTEVVRSSIYFAERGSMDTPTGDTRKHSRRDRLRSFVSRSSLVGRARADPLAETTRQTFIQCTLYVVSYFVTYVGIGVITIGQVFFDGVEEHRTFYFFWVSLIKILLPSTGIWNFWIFCRPRLVILRKQNPDVSTISLLWQIIFHSKQQAGTPARTRKPVLPPVPEVHAAPVHPSTTFEPSSLQDENDDDDFTPELYAANSDPTEEEESEDGIDMDAYSLPPTGKSRFDLGTKE